MRETGGRRPDTGQRQRGTCSRHSALVVKWISNSNVTVPADAAQMQQRSGREQNVIGVEHIARQRSEQPLASNHLQEHAPH